MILNKKDLNLYLEEDRKRNGISKSYFKYFLRFLIGVENACSYRYIRCLRLCEYYYNNRSNVFFSLLFLYYKVKLHHLGQKYRIFIPLNVCGYGLRIIHSIGGVYINAKRVGNYCGFNSGTIIGNIDSQDNRPEIGDYTAFGPGAKAFGKIVIGDNVFVAPNAVVTKDVINNSIVGGVPAKLIRYKD